MRDLGENSDKADKNDNELNLSRIHSLLDSNNDPKTRRRAVKALGNPSRLVEENKKQVVDRLVKIALTDTDDDIRAEAINSLYFHDEKYIDRVARAIANRTDAESDAAIEETFLEWLTADHAEFRMVGATGIHSYGTEVTVSLRDALVDSDPRVQARAVRAYGVLEPVSVEPIRPLLETYNSHVRHAAVTALTTIGTPAALSMLSSVAQANDETLRRIAVEHLYKLDHEQSARVLLMAVQDRSEAVRYTAMISLIRLCAEGKAVRPAAVREQLVANDSFDHAEVAELLLQIITQHRSDHATLNTRRYASWLLGEIAACVDSPAAVQWLLGPFEHTDTILADIAAAYLPEIESPTVEKELHQIIEDDDASPDVTTRAQLVLGKIRQNAASDVETQSMEYTYIRRPAEYTEKHAY